MTKFLQFLWNAYAHSRLRKIESDNKAIRAELHVFKTEVLDVLIASNEKISKRMETRMKREQQKQEVLDDDGFDTIRKIKV